MKSAILKTIILICIINLSANAQQERFGNITTYDGLPNAFVTKIAQDKYGFIWIGTINGLSKYDGYSLKNYLYNSNDTNSIPYNEITCLYIDNNGSLYVGTEKGISKYNYESETFSSAHPNDISLNNKINCIIRHNDQGLLIGSPNGLFRYNEISKRSEEIKIANYNKPDIRDLYIDKNNYVWIAMNNYPLTQLWFNDKKIEAKQHLLYPNPKDIRNIFLSTIAPEDNGLLWIGQYTNGVSLYDPLKKKIIDRLSQEEAGSKKLQNNSIECLLRTNDGSLFIANEGLYIYSKNELVAYKKNFLKENEFVDNTITDIIQSRDGLIFIATHKGVVTYDPSVDKVKCFIHPKGLTDYYFSVCNGIIPEENEIFTCMWTHGNYSQWNKKTAVYKDFNTSSISNIRNFKKESDGTLIIAPLYSEIQLIQKDNILKLNIEGEKKFTMIEGDSVYITIKNSLYLYDKRKMRGETLFTVAGESLQSIIKDESGLFWINGEYSLISYNPKTNIYDVYKIITEENTKFSYPLCIKEDTIYCASLLGIVEFNTRTKQFKHYETSFNTQLDYVKSALTDYNRRVWFFGYRNVHVLDLKSAIIYTLDTRSVFHNIGFNHNSCILNNDGLIYAGGSGGISVFNPALMLQDTLSFKPSFTELKIFDDIIKPGTKSILKKSITECRLIEFNYKQTVFTIAFSLLKYSTKNKIKYAYMLDGLDNRWYNLETKNSILFTHLPSGKYTLNLIALDENGKVHEADPLIIIIHPPFWLTWWFITLLIGGIIISAIWYYYNRTKNILEQNKKLNLMVRERTEQLFEQKDVIERKNKELANLNASKDKLFSVIGHDLKNPFHAISGFGSILLNNYEEYSDEQKMELIKLMQSSSENAISLLENLLHWSRSNMNKIAYKPIPCNLAVIINDNVKYLRILAENKKIQIKTTGESTNLLADYDMISTVIRNLMANAIKFTPENGSITIHSEENDKSIFFSISDNGIGMNKETINKLFRENHFHTTQGTQGETGTGLGLHLCKEFVERNKGIITITSEVGKGSTFKVEFPFTKKKLE